MLVIRPDSDFFRYFGDASGAARTGVGDTFALRAGAR